MIWTGLSFTVLGHHDGRFLHTPGLFAFARRDSDQGSVLLFAGEAEDLAHGTGCGHAQWEEALHLGMDELHVHFPVPRRIDRLQLLSRVVRHTQPLLNRLEEAAHLAFRCRCGMHAYTLRVTRPTRDVPEVLLLVESQRSING